jgi:hypothetical protein
MNKHQLSKSSKEQEYNTIRQIMYNNKYNPSTLNISKAKRTGKQEKKDKKRAKFTYTGKETRFIAKLFKNSPIRISFTTNNTIGKNPQT